MTRLQRDVACCISVFILSIVNAEMRNYINLPVNKEIIEETLILLDSLLYHHVI